MDGLDTYDACCLALAFMDERWSSTDLSFNETGTAELHKALGISIRQVSESVNDDLAEMRASIGGGTGGAPPPPVAAVNSTKEDVDEMRAAMMAGTSR